MKMIKSETDSSLLCSAAFKEELSFMSPCHLVCKAMSAPLQKKKEILQKYYSISAQKYSNQSNAYKCYSTVIEILK